MKNPILETALSWACALMVLGWVGTCVAVLAKLAGAMSTKIF